MTTAVDVSKYIRARMDVLGEMQVQKLTYYAQAWTLAWTGEPLFDDKIEAWAMGPVLPSLRYRRDKGDATAVGDARAAAIIDAVVGHYGELTGAQLRDLTHAEAPWHETYANRGHMRRECSDEVERDLMRRFYSNQSLQGEGPKSPQVFYEEPDLEELDAIVDANAERWREALDLLSR